MRSGSQLLFSLFICVLSFAFAPAKAQDTRFVTTTRSPISAANLPSVTTLATLPRNAVNELTWSRDSAMLAAATAEGVYVYDVAGGGEPRLLGEAMTPATSASFSPDGRTLLAAAGTALRLWDVENGIEVSTLDGMPPVVFSPNGDIAASAGGNNTVQVWEAASGTLLATLEGHTNTITGLRFSPNGTILASSSLDETMRYWDPYTGEQIGFQRSRRRPVTSVDFNAGGFLIATGAQRGIVRLLNIAVDTERVLARGGAGDVRAISFHPDGTLLAFSGSSNVKVWDVGAAEERAVLRGHSDLVVSVAFSPDGTLLASAGRDDVIRLWGVEG